MPGSNGKFVSSGVVVGKTKLSGWEQKLQHTKGGKVTMGTNYPGNAEGAVGDITIRTITSKGFRAFVKTNTGWVDVNSMTARITLEWIDMNLLSSWVRYDDGTDFTLPQYCKDSNGFVHLRGTMKDGIGANQIITELPEGFRPPKKVSVAAANDDGQCSVEISIDGEVKVTNGGSTSRQHLDGVSFFAWQDTSISGGGGGGGHGPAEPGSGGDAIP